MISLVLTTAAVFTLAVVVHRVVTQFTHNERYVRNAFVVFIIVCIGALPLALQFGIFGFLVMYAALVILWNSYLVFFINLINSVSLRMVDEIERSPSKTLTTDEVENLYSDEEALETRLQTLVRNGFLVDRGGEGLQLTQRGTQFARFLDLARKAFGIDSFG